MTKYSYCCRGNCNLATSGIARDVDKKVAIIDLGTNTFHLLFAEWNGAQYNIVFRERLAVKIGMGGINTGVITDAGVVRAIDALKKFKAAIQSAGITEVTALGTSALRNAKNGKEVAVLIQNNTGIAVNIISGDEEAEYIYHGVRKALKMGEHNSLVVDIGGGSVECIIGNENTIFWKQSFEIGAQRLLERFQKNDPIRPDEIIQIDDYLSRELQPLMLAFNEFKPIQLIGSSGTFDTLSEIYHLRQNIPYLPDSPETQLTIDSFHQTFQELKSKNRVERLQIPGMIEMRVDMIVVACCLIDFLLKQHEFTAIRVSTYSLKEGVLAGLV
jgi:exopolyphosphatase/guanosine-5'-triphosphate,3'-diphosphate pyrophosphatase